MRRALTGARIERSDNGLTIGATFVAPSRARELKEHGIVGVAGIDDVAPSRARELKADASS